MSRRFCRELVLLRADCPFAAFRCPAEAVDNIRMHTEKWPERVVFDTSRLRLAPAENAQAETEASQKPVAAERHDPVQAFAETGRETVEGCWRPPCSADHNPESDASRKRPAALLRYHPGLSRVATAFIAPNPFHKLPGKS